MSDIWRILKRLGIKLRGKLSNCQRNIPNTFYIHGSDSSARNVLTSIVLMYAQSCINHEWGRSLPKCQWADSKNYGAQGRRWFNFQNDVTVRTVRLVLLPEMAGSYLILYQQTFNVSTSSFKASSRLLFLLRLDLYYTNKPRYAYRSLVVDDSTNHFKVLISLLNLYTSRNPVRQKLRIEDYANLKVIWRGRTRRDTHICFGCLPAAGV